MDYTCTCDEGYEGRNCETDTDDCVSVLCGGHGMCLDGLASFTCSCETGYSGELCEELGECGITDTQNMYLYSPTGACSQAR